MWDHACTHILYSTGSHIETLAPVSKAKRCVLLTVEQPDWLPAVQLVQLVLPPGAYCPALHGTHGVLACESASAKPAAHGSHRTAPAAETVPGKHKSQGVVAFLSRSLLPATHGVHCRARADEYVPAGHCTQGVAALESSSAVPVVQLLHSVCPWTA